MCNVWRCHTRCHGSDFSSPTLMSILLKINHRERADPRQAALLLLLWSSTSGQGKGLRRDVLPFLLGPFGRAEEADGAGFSLGSPTGRSAAGLGRAGSRYLGWPGRVRLQFGEPQVGGGLLLFPGSWRFFFFFPSLLSSSFSSSRFPD